jgi:hypothetical protein
MEERLRKLAEAQILLDFKLLTWSKKWAELLEFF